MHMLNDKWLDVKMQQAMTEQSERDLKKLRAAVKRLAWASVPVSTYEDIQNVSDEQVDNRIDQAVSDWKQQAVKLMLDDDSMTLALKRYEDTRSELHGHVKTIKDMLEKYPNVPIKVDKNNVAYFDSKQLEAFIKDKATIVYTTDDKAYYQKLGALVDALNDLRTFERDNHLTPFSTKDTQNIYSGGIVNLYDAENDEYHLTRNLFAEMVHIGLVMGHIPTASEAKEMRQKYGATI